MKKNVAHRLRRYVHVRRCVYIAHCSLSVAVEKRAGDHDESSRIASHKGLRWVPRSFLGGVSGEIFRRRRMGLAFVSAS